MGDERAPSPSESTHDMLQAYKDYFPSLMGINAENILPTEKAKLSATQAVSPGYSKLQEELYRTYGPLLAQTSDKIDASRAQDSAQSDLNIVKGTGRDLVKEAIDTQKLADPEYYNARSRVGGGLGSLFDSINLSGDLSGGESEELQRATARENQNRGIAGNPSQTAAIANALTFGNARHQRQNEAKGQLGAAIGLGTGFLPTAQSGMDVFKVATGKTSMPNAGDSKFTGVQQGVGDSTFNTGNNFLNNVSALTQQTNDINANRRDLLDRMNEVGSALGSLS